MRNINPKAIKTKSIQAAYDIALNFFLENPEKINGDLEPQTHVISGLSAKLKEVGYPRVENLDAILRSHQSTIDTGKKEPFTPDTADDTALQLASTLTGTTLKRPDQEDVQQGVETPAPSGASAEVAVPVIEGMADAPSASTPVLATKVRTPVSARAAFILDAPGDIDCAIVMEKGKDLFPRSYGGVPGVLDFDVPRLEFDKPHPAVPAIDPTFRFNTRVLMEALHAVASNEIIWLYGESGCGKTEFWRQVAAHLGMPFTRLNMDGHLTRSDIIGSMRFVRHADGRQEMAFVDGILPRAMALGGLLLIDEMDLGDPEIMPVLQPVLEGNPLVIAEDGGRVVVPHDTFRIQITGNTRGLGSENQMYLNAFEQSAATRDRISAFVEMPYLPADMEEQVVMDRFPDSDPDFVKNVVHLANKVRDGYKMGAIHSLFSTRAVQSCVTRHNRFAKLYPTPQEAAQDVIETVIMNRLDQSSTQAVKEIVDQIF